MLLTLHQRMGQGSEMVSGSRLGLGGARAASYKDIEEKVSSCLSTHPMLAAAARCLIVTYVAREEFVFCIMQAQIFLT